MSKYSINVQWSDRDEAFIATSPEFPELLAFGDTHEEAVDEARVAMDLLVESYQEDGDPLPEPTKWSEYSGQLRLRMPKSLHGALARHAEREGVSMNTLMVSYLERMLGREEGQQEVSTVVVREIRRLLHGRDELSSHAESSDSRTEYVEEYGDLQDPTVIRALTSGND